MGCLSASEEVLQLAFFSSEVQKVPRDRTRMSREEEKKYEEEEKTA